MVHTTHTGLFGLGDAVGTDKIYAQIKISPSLSGEYTIKDRVLVARAKRDAAVTLHPTVKVVRGKFPVRAGSVANPRLLDRLDAPVTIEMQVSVDMYRWIFEHETEDISWSYDSIYEAPASEGPSW